MSIQGPQPNPNAIPAIPAFPATRAPRPAAPAEPERAAATTESRSLWDLLTPEERTFFQQLATVGRLTYGPGTPREDANAAAPTGRRIDVRG